MGTPRVTSSLSDEPVASFAKQSEAPRRFKVKRAGIGIVPALALLTPTAASAAALEPSTLVAVDGGLIQAFVQATSLIFLSEIGDKTFFIVQCHVTHTSLRSLVRWFETRETCTQGAFLALVLMTIISVVIGQIFHAVPDSFTGGYPVDDYVAIASFVYFGIKSITGALASDTDDGLEEELKSAEEELAKGSVIERTRGKAVALASEAFALTVAAEIGDRSQISTIALSAAQNPYVVAIGACTGHGLATGIAVLGGSFISKYVSEKGVSLIAGVLFLVFAVTTFFGVF
ncbi:hypothetical protein CTAYLR_000214 [Chrysophaeum taylorii]|uniref:GDT1 family protein n=1 Tax=Chrysophaeum taylorii TaxID=2483200 RepID=A0AAD7UEM2_9STRA|nr:hypothetical protein CTAYLR_000214 [Chrysophaeum taylorii]